MNFSFCVEFVVEVDLFCSIALVLAAGNQATRAGLAADFDIDKKRYQHRKLSSNLLMKLTT